MAIKEKPLKLKFLPNKLTCKTSIKSKKTKFVIETKSYITIIFL